MSIRMWLDRQPDAGVVEDEIYGGDSINDPTPAGNPDEDDSEDGKD